MPRPRSSGPKPKVELKIASVFLKWNSRIHGICISNRLQLSCTTRPSRIGDPVGDVPAEVQGHGGGRVAAWYAASSSAMVRTSSGVEGNSYRDDIGSMVSAFNPADRAVARRLLMFSVNVRNPGFPAQRLVAEDEAGVRPDGFRSDQRGDVDDPLPSVAHRLVEQADRRWRSPAPGRS